MADSLKASEAGLRMVDQARRHKRWRKTAEAWCSAAFTSRATLNRFWGGKAIRSETFMAICDAVNVDWQRIVDPAFSQTTGVPLTRGDNSSGITEACKQSSFSTLPPTSLISSPHPFTPSSPPIPPTLREASTAFTSPPSGKPLPHLHSLTPSSAHWNDAPDTAGFVGREAELRTLSQWLQDESCRMIVLLGMGGIGKSTLAIKTAQLFIRGTEEPESIRGEKLESKQGGDRNSPKKTPPHLPIPPSPHFSFFPSAPIIWRSLRNAPPIESVIQDCIGFLLPQALPQLPTHIDGLVNWLLKALCTCRCLLILDNLESILQEGSRTGNYRQGFEGYGQLLRALSEAPHSSQVIITSREMPRGLSAREGRDLPVRCLKLSGLLTADSQAIFQYKGTFSGSEPDWQTLATRYAGNPLALKIVASTIRDFFGSDIGQFLHLVQQESFILDDIRDLIARQFDRLPPLEQSLMYWLAINREPVTLPELQADLMEPSAKGDLLQALALLQQRALIEKQEDTFTQQPVVMEYVTVRLIDQVATELLSPPKVDSAHRSLLATHALSKATSHDYIRNSQINLIIKPLLQNLAHSLPTATQIQSTLHTHLAQLKSTPTFPSPHLPISSSSLPLPAYAPANLLTLLQHLNTDLTGYDFSGLSIWQANLQDYALHQVNFAGCNFSRSVFTENLGNILAAVFCPQTDLNGNPQTLATCDTDCTVRLWEATSGKLLKIFQGHTNWVRTVAFSPCGRILASGGGDHTLRLWDVDSEACLRICQGHNNEVFAVTFSPDGKWVASSSSDRTIRLWESHSGNCVQVLAGHQGCVRTLAICPGSITLASGSDDGTIRIWDLHTGRCLQILHAHAGGVRSVAMASGRSSEVLYLASGGGDHRLMLWNAYTGEQLRTYTGHSATVYAVAFAPGSVAQDDPLLVSGSGDHTIRLWHGQTGQCLKTLTGHSNQVGALAFDPVGKTLLAVSLDQTMRLWDMASAQPIRTWTSHTDWVYPVVFSPDGQRLVSGSNNGSVRVWNVAQQSCQLTMVGHYDQVCAVAVCPENQLIASASRDQTIRMWDANTGQCYCILQGHTDWVYSVAFSPTLQAPSGFPLLASGGADGMIRLWDCHTAECLHTFIGHEGQVWDLAFAQTGLLASAGADHTARVWDTTTGECLQILKGHNNRVYAVAFLPSRNDEILITGSSDTTLKAWRWRPGKCLRTHAKHRNWVFSVAVSPDGSRFVSGSHDRTLCIWDAKTGDCLHNCTGHEHLVSSVAYSPDGRLIASGSQDQSVRLWDSQTGECVGILRAPRLYEGMNLAQVTGLTAAQLQTLKALGATM
jgi:WD40 repeat protein/DNA-binding Xre family transcriptional regulator